MKILCELAVHNRLARHLKPRRAQSTLAIGLHPPRSTDPANIFIIIFSTNNRAGTRYKIHGNIEKVFTKFLKDGKTTISIKHPPHDLQIRCDPVQLKSFLQILKTAIEGTFDPKKNNISSLAVTPVPQSAIPVKKLTIESPAEYPVKGLPKSLIKLDISGIPKHCIDSRILNLFNLQILHLSHNCIDSIPKQLGELSLIELDLSCNDLHKANYLKDWDWCDGRIIQTSLKSLDLSVNKLTNFPFKLVNLHNLCALRIDHNNLTRIPFAIRGMKSLKEFRLGNNKLASLPDTLSRMVFDTFDVSGFDNFCRLLRRKPVTDPPSNPERKPSQLWQLAAQIVISKKLKYLPGQLPTDVIDMLEKLPFCDCGKLCMPSPIYPRTKQFPIFAKNFVSSAMSFGTYFDSVYCNDYCRYTYNKHHFVEIFNRRKAEGV